MMKYYTTTTKYNCGIDLHARQMYACVMDREGKILVHTNIQGNDFAYFLKRVEPYRHDLTVVCECTFNWYWLADACEEAGIAFVLAHALYAAHIHGGKNKNDRIDSEKLAHLLRSNLIPPSYLYPAAKRPVRALLRQRMRYVWSRSELMTHLSMNQTAEGCVPALKGGHNRDVWQERILAQTPNPYHQMAVRCDMDAIRMYDQLIDKLDGTITFHAREHQGLEYQLLRSVPGIGEVLSMTILYEIDTIHRFPTVKDFTSYCRLVKGSVASAGRIKGLTGGKMGNAYLRWAFGEAAVICKRAHRLITPYAERLISKHGKFKGNAILANQIARSVYFMLHSGQSFDAERMIRVIP
ncbi:MAG: IS110 family transposase [Kiritimatiellae bacterium]|nr:IS110 family transposase [Kiritimatiellia bacterium]MCB1101700.1 IS110 family transposase [Kiritimatiellia bacterium]